MTSRSNPRVTSPTGGSGGLTERGRRFDEGASSGGDRGPTLEQAGLARSSILDFGTDDFIGDPRTSGQEPLVFGGGSTGRGTGGGAVGGGGGGRAGPAPIRLNLENSTLIRVDEPEGPHYYVEFLVYGVPIRHDIGDQADLDGLGPQPWPASITVGFAEFNNREGIDVGLIDERFNIDESYQTDVDRQLRVFGKEDLPDWQRGSKEVMTTLLQAANEGFSPGRTLGLVAETDAFKSQHPFFSAVRGIHTPGASLAESLAYYQDARDQMRESTRALRGIEADVTDETIGQIMSEGWDPEEYEDALTGEAVMRQMTGMTDQINNLLKFQGSDLEITDDNLLDLILDGETDRTPFGVQELINDAIRAQAFSGQGVELSPALASALGSGEAFETLDPNQVGQIAQETATNIFRFGQELHAEREGLTRDDLIRAMVDGDMSAQVSAKLSKFARRRQIEAQGLTASSQQTAQGRLRILSASGL